MYVSGWQKRLVTTSLVPRPVLLGIAAIAARLMRQRIRRGDRLDHDAAPSLCGREPDLYVADIYHGGVTFWDWVVLRGGGLWWQVLWPLVIETTVERLHAYPELRAVLELDAQTYEELEVRRNRSAIAEVRAAIRTGSMEIVNGTYAQPLAQTISGEANLRHFSFGLPVIARALNARVESFVAGEPQFFPQLPQVLTGFGIRNAVLRTHWAPFGTDPAADSAIVRWQGPDGSQIRTVPRYGYMDYTLMKEGHPGVQNAGLTGDDFEQWSEHRKSAFATQAAKAGIARPFVTRLADPKPPESPFPKLISAAHQPNARLVTVREYLALPPGKEPLVSYAIDDIPSTIPWGLAGEQLHREQVRAESTLLIAERLDVIAQSLGNRARDQQLDAAWKLLLRAQHHDLHLCSPWHSTRHGISMGEVGCEFARQSTRDAQSVVAGALATLATRCRPHARRGRAFLLFNPSPWPRDELVQLPADSDVEVRQGETRLPAQMVRGSGDRTVAFIAQLPPLSTGIVELHPAKDGTARQRAPLHGHEAALFREATASGAQETYFTVWENGRYHRSTVEAMELEHDGPVFRRYQVRSRLLDLPIAQSVTVIPALQRVQVTTEIDFTDGRYLGPQLSDHCAEVAYYIQDEKKLCLNFVSRLPHLFCDSPFLLVEPEAARFIGLSFAGLETPGSGGVALLHKGTPGWHIDRANGVVRNVLAWAPEQWLYASDDSVTPGRSRYTAIRGVHRYEHAVACIRTRLDAVRAAHDFRMPVLAVDLPDTGGSPTPPRTFFDLTMPESVVLTALFARQGHTYARLWNVGESRHVTFSPATPVSFRLEEEPASTWPQMRSWGIQTVRLTVPSKPSP